jgi:hypothetical protein
MPNAAKVGIVAVKRNLRQEPQPPRAAQANGVRAAAARALMAQFPRAEAEAAFYAELRAYIRTDPAMRAQQARRQKAQFDDLSRRLEAEYGERLAIPARVMSLAVQALLLGFTAQWERTPDEVTEDVIATALEALARGAAR